MRRYLGTAWLSMKETCAELAMSEDDVFELFDAHRLAVVWIDDRPYASAGQVGELALRFLALRAALSDWEEEGC